MGLDELRARLDNLLRSQGLGEDRRARAGGLRDALVELKLAASQGREALAQAERDLAAEEQRLADAERRGRLALEIGDAETARVAEEFAAKHRERAALLQRKVGVIRDELAFAEREYESLASQYKDVRLGADRASPAAQGAAALEVDPEYDRLRAQAERAAKDAAVQAQLEHLKKKLGKQG